MTFVKISDVKPGDTLVADGGFDCLKEGQRCVVEHDPEFGLFVRCDEGTHDLIGQLGDDDEVVGFTKELAPRKETK